MPIYKYSYNKNSNISKLKRELKADLFFSEKVVKVIKKKNHEGVYQTEVSLNVSLGGNESMLRSYVIGHEASEPLELEEEYLRMRKEHGEFVVERFRLMSIASGVSGADSLAMFELLGSLASMLRLGLLSDTAYVLTVMQGVPLLDVSCVLDPSKTVREFFVDLCLEGNVTTEELL